MFLSFFIERYLLCKKRRSNVLILSRRVGEAIMIGDDIIIRVMEIGGQVRLGIIAPREIEVHREEIYQRIKAGQLEPSD